MYEFFSVDLTSDKLDLKQCQKLASLAERYSSAGNIVVGTYRSEDKLSELRKIPNSYFFFCDVNKKDSISKFTEAYAALGLNWDLFISCAGTLKPIKPFFDCDFDEWSESIHVNAIEQLRVLHSIYPYRNKNEIPTVIFFAGGGTNNAVSDYSAYTASKIMLIKMTELLDFENKDMSFFIIGPGWVKTKIHNETLQAGEEKAGINYNKTVEFLKTREGTSMDDIYDCINWLASQSKEAVSGRNFSVVYDSWREPLNNQLITKLNFDKDMYKLRRYGNETI